MFINIDEYVRVIQVIVIASLLLLEMNEAPKITPKCHYIRVHIVSETSTCSYYLRETYNMRKILYK